MLRGMFVVFILFFVFHIVRIRRRREGLRSLSHLLMSFLFYLLLPALFILTSIVNANFLAETISEINREYRN